VFFFLFGAARCQHIYELNSIPFLHMVLLDEEDHEAINKESCSNKGAR
jgi:hypothetical protein